MQNMNKEIDDFEANLLDELRAGQSGAFDRLFNTYWRDLYERAYRRLGDQSEAEDMVQDIFISLWDRRQSLEIRTPLQSYLRAALKYKIIRWYSKASIHREAVAHIYASADEGTETIMDILLSKDVNHTIQQTISSFPENMKKVFMMRTDNYSINEIAEALGLAQQTVKNNQTEAIKRLKVILGETHPELKGSMFLLLLLIS